MDPLRPSSPQAQPHLSTAARGSQGLLGPAPGLPRPAGTQLLSAAPTAAGRNEAAPQRPRSASPPRVGITISEQPPVPALTAATTQALEALQGLRQLAGQLQELGQARAALDVPETDAAGTSSSAACAPASEPPERLAHGLELAITQRQSCHAERTRREEDLDRIERKQAKTQQRLDGEQAPQETLATAAQAPSTGPKNAARAVAVAGPAPEAAPASAPSREIKEVKAGLAELDRQIGDLRKQFARVLRERVVVAKGALEKQKKAANALLSTEEVFSILSRETHADGLQLRRSFRLPEVHAPATAGQASSFDQYLARFTEPDDAGALQLRPDLRQGEQCRAVLSALCAEAVRGMPVNIDPLFDVLLSKDMQAGSIERLIANSPRQNADLLKPAVSAALGKSINMLVHLASQGTPTAPRPARRRERAGRAEAKTAFVPTATALALVVRHREEFQAGLLGRAAQILSVIAGNRQAATGMTRTLERQLAARKQDLDTNIRQIRSAEEQRNAEQARLQALQAAERAATRTTASASTPTGAAAIPPTATVHAGPDREARILKLRGDLAELAGQHTAASNLLDAAVAKDQSAAREERKAQAAYETAVAAWGRAQDSIRREWEQTRTARAAQREQLARLEGRIGEAREALKCNPALTRLLQPADAQRHRAGTLERAIERHVEPDDGALRERARHATGYAAAYHSLGHLAEAACDVYEHAVRHCPGLFAARSRAEFQAAAAALLAADGQGIDKRVCPHPRDQPIARGYSNDPDQTRRAVPVNESCYALAWQDGRVLISHLYPLVPHRRLRTLEP